MVEVEGSNPSGPTIFPPLENELLSLSVLLIRGRLATLSSTAFIVRFNAFSVILLIERPSSLAFSPLGIPRLWITLPKGEAPFPPAEMVGPLFLPSPSLRMGLRSRLATSFFNPSRSHTLPDSSTLKLWRIHPPLRTQAQILFMRGNRSEERVSGIHPFFRAVFNPLRASGLAPLFLHL